MQTLTEHKKLECAEEMSPVGALSAQNNQTDAVLRTNVQAVQGSAPGA